LQPAREAGKLMIKTSVAGHGDHTPSDAAAPWAIVARKAPAKARPRGSGIQIVHSRTSNKRTDPQAIYAATRTRCSPIPDVTGISRWQAAPSPAAGTWGSSATTDRQEVVGFDLLDQPSLW